jgi:hypothetical protein
VYRRDLAEEGALGADAQRAEPEHAARSGGQ